MVDGDTIDMTVDLGFRIGTSIRVRLAYVDTPEIYGVKKSSKEYAEGVIARDHVESMVAEYGNAVTIETRKTEKYGRWLGSITFDNGLNLNERMIALGYGSPEVVE